MKLNPDAAAFTPTGIVEPETINSNDCLLAPHVPPNDIDELGGFEILTNPQADMNGPLSINSIDLENRRHEYNFDKKNPICRHRHTPIGSASILNDQDKEWLAFAHDNNLWIEIQRQNPKQTDSDSYNRYQTSSKAKTTRAYYSALSNANQY